jgi:hypothetical protein
MPGDLSQHALCLRYGSAFVPPDGDERLGIALSTLGQAPLNALRHQPESGTCGWYVWGGEFSEHVDFFQPLHVHHLVAYAPQLIPYLGLAPGWRVLLAEGQSDVWRDPSLLFE